MLSLLLGAAGSVLIPSICLSLSLSLSLFSLLSPLSSSYPAAEWRRSAAASPGARRPQGAPRPRPALVGGERRGGSGFARSRSASEQYSCESDRRQERRRGEKKGESSARINK